MSATPGPAVAAMPEPFWQRIPSIVLYPVRGAALVSLIGLGLFALLGSMPFIGLLASIAMWIGAYKYAFEILRRTADGDMDPPEVVLTIDNGVVWRFIALQILLGVAFGVALIFGGLKGGVVALVAIALLQPALTMTLAMTGSLSETLDPSTAFSVVSRVGWPYIAVVGLLFVIQASAFTAAAWLGHLMPSFAAHWLATMFGFWGLFSAFHLMGYLLYQAHDALGFEPASLAMAAAHPGLAKGGHGAGDIAIPEAEALIRDGRMQDALALLRTEVRTRAVPQEVHDLYRRLLQKVGEPAGVQEHARQYLHQLMMEKQDRRALGLLRESLDADPAFVPLSTEHGERLAEQARLGGQAQLAVDALHAMFNAHPNEPASARWGLQAAMLLLERFDRSEDAKVLLERARTRTTDPAVLQKIDGALSLT